MSRSKCTVPIQLIRAMAAVGIRHGWDVEELMLSAGIPMRLLTDRRSQVTPEQVDGLVTMLAQATDDEMLGLGAEAVPPGTFRMLGYALLGAPDLIHALARFRHFNRALPGMPAIEVVTEGAMSTLLVDVCAIGLCVDILVAAGLAATHRVLEWATNSRIHLQRAEVPHPLAIDVDDYAVIFGAPVVSSTGRSALVFPTTVLARPIVRNQEDWDGFLRKGAAHMLSRRDYAQSIGDRVRHILEQSINRQWPTADDVAARLAMSPQTMRRKLHEEGESLSQIRQDVRRHAAIAGVIAQQETMAALSRKLGFSEPSTFTRAFRQWTGISPSGYLIRHRLGASSSLNRRRLARHTFPDRGRVDIGDKRLRGTPVATDPFEAVS